MLWGHRALPARPAPCLLSHPRPAGVCLGFPVRLERGPCAAPGSGPGFLLRASHGGGGLRGWMGPETAWPREPLVSLEPQTPRSSDGGQESRGPRVEGAQ